jgi:hypothetical protein
MAQRFLRRRSKLYRLVSRAVLSLMLKSGPGKTSVQAGQSGQNASQA